jgi:hypothetical protein
MVTRSELVEACGRLSGSRELDVRLVVGALQRFLAGEGRREFDRRVYMKRYMAEYRKRNRGKVKGRKRR